MSLVLTPISGIPFVQPGTELVSLVQSALQENNVHLNDGDILVFAQKIVSKSEGRLVNLAEITPSPRAVEIAKGAEKDPRLVEVILSESHEVLRVRPGTIIVEHRLGFVCASAGIDHSNLSLDPALTSRLDSQAQDEWVLLLPEDPDASARKIREGLQAESGKNLGVMIIDSHGRAWRLGTVGAVIGMAGVPGLVDLRGRKIYLATN